MELFKQFKVIWLEYINILPIEPYEIDIYIKIIDKIKENNYDFSENKNDFIKLINIMSMTIYYYKYNDENKYNDEDDEYNEDYNYENDIELKCCYDIKEYLKL
jgi:hypothetical protein